MHRSLQNRIRMLSLMVIAAGTVVIATPRTAVAGPDDVCCQVGSGPRCCGGACEATSTTCEACTSFWGCFLF